MGQTTQTTTDSVAERIARLGLTEIGDKRLESLTIAHEAGVNDEVFTRLGNATRLGRAGTIVLPAHRFEGLSRGKGWARMGRGSDVTWGERADGGYRVGPGRWTVGGNDGFARKGEDTWTVSHVTVGAQAWTVAV